ncbi:MAG: cytochrome ubiquinol oxidase subunit I, partial [Gemmatimonadales bacterium]
ATLIFAYTALWSRRRGAPAGDDPWEGATLEWTTSSPPPPYNFSVIPEVVSRLPRWSQTEMKAIPEVPPGPIHVPAASFWPVVAALGLLIAGTGAVSRELFVALGGVAVLVVSIYAWAFEPFEV